jgi:YegS/Rv2252/BmrU family lipid kinase
MRRATFIFNPVSGHRQARRRADVEAAAAVLRGAGGEVSLAPTSAPGAAAQLASEAVAAGADTIFACGGDGTVHEVLQGLIGTEAALGIVPLGTANSLAWDLGIPRNVARAATAALGSKAEKIAVGRVLYRSAGGEPASRYFIMNVGIGMDALLFYRLNAIWKQRMGMSAYYFEAFRQWCTARYEYFDCEFATPAGEVRHECVTQAMSVRVADFGGIVGKLAPGANLRRDDMRLLLFKTARRSDYLRYMMRTAVRARWTVPGVELADAVRLHCSCQDDARKIYVEADGELLGTLPAQVEMAGERVVRLLMPQSRWNR